MKYGIRTEIPGMTQEQYDQVHAIFESKARAARGAGLSRCWSNV